MNARSVRKRLMRGRRCSFWGDRAYLRVRLPASLVPTAPPAVDFLTQYGHHDALDAFLDAGYWAKSTRAGVDGDVLLLEFGVKWRYPKRRRGFCADIARAMKVAKRLGVEARVLKGDGQ